MLKPLPRCARRSLTTLLFLCARAFVQVGKKRGLPYSGLSAYLSELETPEEYENNFRNFKAIEQRMERRIRISEERKESAKMV
jgi:hypothetical protein